MVSNFPEWQRVFGVNLTGVTSVRNDPCKLHYGICTVVNFAQVVSEHTGILKFMYSKTATKFCEISTLLLSYVVPVKSKMEISQNFVAFSEYMNFISKKYYEIK